MGTLDEATTQAVKAQLPKLAENASGTATDDSNDEDGDDRDASNARIWQMIQEAEALAEDYDIVALFVASNEADAANASRDEAT